MSWLTDNHPVLVKELRGRMRGARAFVVLTSFLVVLSAFSLLLYLVVGSVAANDPFSAGRAIGKALFIGVTIIALVQVLVIVPAQAAGAISSERERQTFDLLIATQLPSWKIVLGKLLASLAYAVLLIVATVPLMALAFFFGGVTGTEVVIALIGLLVTALLYGAIGILWSVISVRTLTSTVLTQATNILLMLGIPFLMFVFGMVFFRSSDPPSWIETYVFVYSAGLVVALHPFIALGAAETFLSNGQTGWFIPLTLPRGPIWIPAPWLAFTLEGIVVASLLVALAVRMLRPNEPGASHGRSQRRNSRRPTAVSNQPSVSTSGSANPELETDR